MSKRKNIFFYFGESENLVEKGKFLVLINNLMGFLGGGVEIKAILI